MNITDIISKTEKPKIYEKSSVFMWTDKHISKQLLDIHLNPDIDLGSRKKSTIEKTANWILETQKEKGKLTILDLGCGPGLYAEIFARHYKIILPTEFELAAILFIFGSLFLGSAVGFYYRFWWWDILLHGFSAILLGIIGLLMVWILNHNEKVDISLNPVFICIFSFSFAVAIGVLWEIYEFAFDSFFGADMQKSGLVDTMWDLIVDTSGALLVSMSAYIYYRTGHKSRLINEIQEFLSLNKSYFHTK